MTYKIRFFACFILSISIFTVIPQTAMAGPKVSTTAAPECPKVSTASALGCPKAEISIAAAEENEPDTPSTNANTKSSNNVPSPRYSLRAAEGSASQLEYFINMDSGNCNAIKASLKDFRKYVTAAKNNNLELDGYTTDDLAFFNETTVTDVQAANELCPPSPDEPDVQALLIQARSKLKLPQPSYAMMSPIYSWKGTHYPGPLRGQPVWYYQPDKIWKPISANATAGSASITVTATPVKQVYDNGDETSTTCTDQGEVMPKVIPREAGETWTDDTGDTIRYPPSSCSHTFNDAPPGDFTITCTITWEITAITTDKGTYKLEDMATTRSTHVTVMATTIQLVK